MAVDSTPLSEVQKYLGDSLFDMLTRRMAGYGPEAPPLPDDLRADVESHWGLASTSVDSVARLYAALKEFDSEGLLVAADRVQRGYTDSGWLVPESMSVTAITERKLSGESGINERAFYAALDDILGPIQNTPPLGRGRSIEGREHPY